MRGAYGLGFLLCQNVDEGVVLSIFLGLSFTDVWSTSIATNLELSVLAKAIGLLISDQSVSVDLAVAVTDSIGVATVLLTCALLNGDGLSSCLNNLEYYRDGAEGVGYNVSGVEKVGVLSIHVLSFFLASFLLTTHTLPGIDTVVNLKKKLPPFGGSHFTLSLV